MADIMADLSRDADKNAFESVVIVAPPVALGEMRKVAGGSGLSARVSAWIDKDLTKEPVPSITKAVLRALED